MAGPRGPRKRTLKPGARPEKPSKARAEIRAATVEPIPELGSLPAPAAPVEIVVDSAPVIAPVSGGSSGRSAGALPRSKKKTPASVKAALERAVATSEGKEPPKVSTKGVDPKLVREFSEEAKAAKEAIEAEAGTAAPLSAPDDDGPRREGGARIYDVPTVTGRPSEYKEEYVDVSRDLCANGASFHDLADFFQVSLRAIYRWKAAHLAFRQAIFLGTQEFRDAQDQNVERGLYERASGYVQRVEKIMSFQGQIMRVQMEEHVPADVAAARLWLANRRPEEWKNDPDKGSVGSPAEQLGNMALMELARRMGMVLVAGMKAEEAVTLEAIADE